MMKRRTFLGAISTLALPTYLTSGMILNSIESAPHSLPQNKKVTASVFIPSFLRFGVFALLTKKFLTKLNLEIEDIHFIASNNLNLSQIFLSSPSLDYQLNTMLFICRSPGGLCRPDFKNWLNSSLAKNIYESAYSKKGFKPFILCLGPDKNHQPVTISANYKSDQILFGSSIPNSFRSVIKGIEVQTFPTLHTARKKIESSAILSLEALQPKVAASIKSSEIILLEDGLASQPQVYQALVKNEFWDSINFEYKNKLVEHIEKFGQKLDDEIVLNDSIFKSNLANQKELATVPNLILEMRNLEQKFAANYLEAQSIKSNMVSTYEKFRSYQNSSSIKLL